jgi:hypothetical protein
VAASSPVVAQPLIVRRRNGERDNVLRCEHEDWGVPPVLGDEDDTRLVVFVDYDEALKRARGERARREGDAAVGRMKRHEIQEAARKHGFEYILVVHKDGSRDVELVDTE